VKWCFTISPFHHFTISPFHHFTISPFHLQGTLDANASDEIRNAQREGLFSTVHGAGRVMSRTAAAG
jgi:hypothetical protein